MFWVYAWGGDFEESLGIRLLHQILTTSFFLSDSARPAKLLSSQQVNQRVLAAGSRLHFERR